MQVPVEGAIWGAVSWVLFALCDYSFSRRSALRRRSVLVAGMVVVWGASYVCFAAAHALLDMTVRSGRLFPGAFRAGWLGVLLVITVVVVTARGLFWWQREIQAVRRRAESEETLVRTELRVLAEQLEPHFLLNTLTAISTLAGTDPSLAREMTAGLQDLLAYSLRHGAADSVPLGEEVHFIRQYLRLQSLRFGSRLRTSVDVPGELLAFPVPRLILQPLVENALKYGVAQCEEGGEIVIDALGGRDTLTIHVRNSDAGIPGTPGIGIGVAGVRARLALLFGEGQCVLMTHDAPKQMTVVTVTLPLARSGVAA
jgi:signal transduction histidine kinase